MKNELDTIIDEISILAPISFNSESANAELNRLKVLLHQLAETQYHYLSYFKSSKDFLNGKISKDELKIFRDAAAAAYDAAAAAAAACYAVHKSVEDEKELLIALKQFFI